MQRRRIPVRTWASCFLGLVPAIALACSSSSSVATASDSGASDTRLSLPADATLDGRSTVDSAPPAEVGPPRDSANPPPRPDVGADGADLGVVPGDSDAVGGDLEAGQHSSPAHWVMGYYVGYQRSMQAPSEIDWSGLSHVVVGVALARIDGSLDLSFDLGSAEAGERFARETVQAARSAGVRPMLMLGGAGGGASIRSAMQTKKATFEAALLKATHDLGFVGIDLDWEDDVDMDLFLELAADLRAAAPNMVLTVPGGMINGNYQSVDPKILELFEYIDQYNIMSYYPTTMLAGSGWQSWHSSPLDGRTGSTPITIADTFERLVKAGAPKAKLGMGVGFYAACYTGKVTGPNQDVTGSVIAGGDNEYPISELLAPGSIVTASTRRWDEAAKVPYLQLSTPERHGCRYVTYDDDESIGEKGKFAKSQGYGGIIIWTISQGYLPSAPTGQRNPLLGSLKRAFLD